MANSQQNTHQEGKPSHQTGKKNRRAKGDDQTHERSIRQEGETPNSPGKIGGQGMGQGRGMNPGEVHEPPQSENDQKGGDRSDRARASRRQ